MRSINGNDVVVKVGNGSITLKNASGSSINISTLLSSADWAIDDWISVNDTNFVTVNTQIDSIVKPVTDILSAISTRLQ